MCCENPSANSTYSHTNLNQARKVAKAAAIKERAKESDLLVPKRKPKQKGKKAAAGGKPKVPNLV